MSTFTREQLIEMNTVVKTQYGEVRGSAADGCISLKAFLTQRHPLAPIGSYHHSQLSPGATCETPSPMARGHPSLHYSRNSAWPSQSLPSPVRTA